MRVAERHRRRSSRRSATETPPTEHRPVSGKPARAGLFGLRSASRGAREVRFHLIAQALTYRNFSRHSPRHPQPIGTGLFRGKSRGNARLSPNHQEPCPLFVPPGTPDNSPPLQRWVPRISHVHSPGRGDRHSLDGLTFPQISPAFVVPGGTGRFGWIALPPLKRWAIVGCPWRDKTRRFFRECSP